jgi:hypothetical protein
MFDPVSVRMSRLLGAYTVMSASFVFSLARTFDTSVASACRRR